MHGTFICDFPSFPGFQVLMGTLFGPISTIKFSVVSRCFVIECGIVTTNFVCLFDLILYFPVNNFSVMSGQVIQVEQVLGKD